MSTLQGGTVANSNVATSNTSRSFRPSGSTTAPSSIGTSLSAPDYSGVRQSISRRREAAPSSNADFVSSFTDSYASLLEQKAYADILKNLLAQEREYFKRWSAGFEYTPKQFTDLTNFLERMDQGQYTGDAAVDSRVEKALGYIPDIIGALSKNDAIAPAAKVLKGENPVVDETKWALEKVIGPGIKRLGTFLEGRFSGALGETIAKSIQSFGTKLIALPEKVLAAIGPADVIASVTDALLTGIDKATGNYRAKNHGLEDTFHGIPVLGSAVSAIDALEDLLEGAVGIPSDKEAARKLEERLYNTLWKPAMEEHNKVYGDIAGLEDNFANLAEKANASAERNVIYDSLSPVMGELASLLGNDTDAMVEEAGKLLELSPEQMNKYKSDLLLLAQAETGLYSQGQVKDRFALGAPTAADIPEVEQTISPLEITTRMSLDNLYAAQDIIGAYQKEADRLTNIADQLASRITSDEFTSIIGRRGRPGGLPKAKQQELNKLRETLKQIESQRDTLRDNAEELTGNLKEKIQNFQDDYEYARENGVNLPFLESSSNWTDALADIQNSSIPSWLGAFNNAMGYGF